MQTSAKARISLIKGIATVRIELASGRLKSIKGASSESGLAVA